MQPTEIGVRLGDVFDVIPAIVWSASPDGSIDFLNEEWIAYAGKSRQSEAGLGWFGQIHPDDIVRVKTAWIAAVSVGGTFETKARMRGSDGRYHWFHKYARPMRDHGGSIIKWYGLSVDIEEQTLAQQAANRTGLCFEEMQRLTGAGSWTWDVQTRDNTWWSNETYRIFGLNAERDSCSCKSVSERIHAADLPEIHRVIDEAVRGKTHFEVTFRIILADGGIRYVRSIGQPISDISGKLTEYYGTIVDLTKSRIGNVRFDEKRVETPESFDDLAGSVQNLHGNIDYEAIFDEIGGKSEAIQHLRLQVNKVAATDATVLVLGESGTGKECVARAVHAKSSRADGVFLRVNCAAITPERLSSMLFPRDQQLSGLGVASGTGPQILDFGTLLLDEIGDLSMESQLLVLRFLEERDAEEMVIPACADLRIIAITSRDLASAVYAQTFRRDLFYRLNVFPIELPPLRARKADVRPLAEYFAQRYATKLRKRIKTLDENTLQLLDSYEWPGNVCELRNLIERSVTLCEGDTVSVDSTWFCTGSSAESLVSRPSILTLTEREKRAIESVLAETGGRVAGPQGAAAKLGIPRSTLESKIKSLGIKKHLYKN